MSDAPRLYNEVATQLPSWLADCAFILEDQCTKGKAFTRGSAMHQARKKSLLLINEALKHAKVLHEHDISKSTYIAVEELERLRRACSECRSRNFESGEAKCDALSNEARLAVEINFRDSPTSER